ncbi:uncharacterized protein LOC143621435 [Bidens hawaiensis]|uniref:uncharacterized protein LOC143621435 n=1 Tax=Bidens hawaiensis TaxID=980011 RepID=UPI00404992BC
MASTLAARQAATLLRVSSSRSASFIQRRGLAGAADHHGAAKVDFWKDPMSPSKWKEEHFVIISLSGWGLLIFGGYKAFSGGKKNDEKLVEAVN